MTKELTPDLEKVIDRVARLLALAGNNPNEAEASAAAAKAQELLQTWNLDMAQIEGHTKSGKREKNESKGGLYKWQRDLWTTVAHCNFCIHASRKGLRRGSSYMHIVLGRTENVAVVHHIAGYLQQAIDRAAQAEAKRTGRNVFAREMIAFREGMAHRIRERLWTRRERAIAEDKARRERDIEIARQNGSSSTALVVSLQDVIDKEECLNLDAYYNLPEGTTYDRRKKYLADQRREAEEQAAYDRAHPEEAEQRRKAQEKAEKKARAARERQRKPRKLTPEQERQQLDTFWDGMDRGATVNLDPKIEDGKAKHVLGGGE